MEKKKFLARAEFTELNLQRGLEQSRIAFRVILKAKLQSCCREDHLGAKSI